MAWRSRRKRRASSRAVEEGGVDLRPGRGLLGRPFETLGDGVGGVDDHRAELHAGLVLQREGGLDGLAHRHVLGEGDQDHPATGGVGQELDHLGGLGAQRTTPGGVDQPAGRGEKGDGMAGGGRVDDDQVGDRLALELLDLAEDEHVADARDGRRHHVDHPRADQPFGDAAQAVVLEVLHQGVVGRDPPGPHRALSRRRGAGWSSTSS